MKQPEIIHHSRGRTPSGEPNPIDIHVGKRIRLRRSLILMSQVNLAKLLGITFQQIQKYERGMNRISASRLWDMSRVLRVPVEFFYQDMDEDIAYQSPRHLYATQNLLSISDDFESNIDTDPMNRKESIDLIRAYYQIQRRQPEAARNFLSLIRSISKPLYQNEEK